MQKEKMKKIIKNLRYDREKAKKVIEFDGKILYQKKNNECFFYDIAHNDIYVPLPPELREFAKTAGVERIVYGDPGTYHKTAITLSREMYNKLNEIATTRHETKSKIVEQLIRLA